MTGRVRDTQEALNELCRCREHVLKVPQKLGHCFGDGPEAPSSVQCLSHVFWPVAEKDFLSWT